MKALFVLLTLIAAGCSSGPTPQVSEKPSKQWVPDAPEELPELPPNKQIPPDFQAAAQQLTLDQLLDLALRNNEQTNITWLRARAAAAALGSSKGQFYPNATVGFDYEKLKNAFSGGRDFSNVVDGADFSTSGSTETYQPFAQVTWLLFDFGKREATVQQFREALVQANFDHNTQLQSVIFDVIQSFYRYISFKALGAAQDITIQESLKNLDYADQRERAGLATVADVHQAKTRAAQAKYARQSTEGQIQSLRGLVATAVGLSPDAKFEVAPVDLYALPVEDVSKSVEELIADAQAHNPEIAAARAEAARAAASYDATWRRRMPAFRADFRPEQQWRFGEQEYGYVTTVGVSVPLFTGFSLSYDIERARHEREIAASEMRDTSKIIALRVWNDYFAVKTAEQQVVTAKELMDSATISFDVASARYREGVGTILDLLTAEAALGEARAASVDAKTAWLIAVAALAKDSGKLAPPTDVRYPETAAAQP